MQSRRSDRSCPCKRQKVSSFFFSCWNVSLTEWMPIAIWLPHSSEHNSPNTVANSSVALWTNGFYFVSPSLRPHVVWPSVLTDEILIAVSHSTLKGTTSTSCRGPNHSANRVVCSRTWIMASEYDIWLFRLSPSLRNPVEILDVKWNDYFWHIHQTQCLLFSRGPVTLREHVEHGTCVEITKVQTGLNLIFK